MNAFSAHIIFPVRGLVVLERYSLLMTYEEVEREITEKMMCCYGFHELCLISVILGCVTVWSLSSF